MRPMRLMTLSCLALGPFLFASAFTAVKALAQGSPESAPQASGPAQRTGSAFRTPISPLPRPVPTPLAPPPTEPPVVATNAAPAITPGKVFPAETTEKGLPWGSFLLNASLETAELYDDNIYATPTDRVGDYITLISPSVSLTSNWAQNFLQFDAGADLARYRSHAHENFSDFHFGGRGRYDISNDFNIFGGGSFAREHESRESPDNENGIYPTIYNNAQSYLGISKSIGKLAMRFGGTFQRLDYYNVESTTSIIDNHDRDRNIYDVGVRVGYEVLPQYQLFAQATQDWRRYDLSLDNNGFDHNSTGQSADIGINRSGAGALTGEVDFGFLHRDYVDPRFGSLTAPDFGGDFRLQLTPSTRVSGYANRSVQETIVYGAAGYLETVGGLTIRQTLRRDLTANVSGSYAIQEFHGIDRTDDVTVLGAGLKYFILPQVYVGADYQFQRRSSNEALANFDDNLFFVRLGAQLARGYGEKTPITVEDQGFYGGIQAGGDELDTRLEGPRGSNGTLDAGFAGFGFAGGAFAGYAVDVDHWYLGLELEGDKDSVTWHHVNAPAGRVFSPRETNSLGAATRIGYILDQGSLIYGRVGVARTTFDTNYETASGRVFYQSNPELGLRLGGGIETPITNRIFLRLDYTHTDYSSYDVTVPSGTDSFSNTDNLVRVGLIYRFYNQAIGDQNKTTAVPASIYDGFYGGLQAGYGTQVAQDAGPREITKIVTATRGSDGPAGGVFGGYGHTWNRLYFGLELDADASGEGFNKQREGSGMSSAVETDATLGASVRLGYVLDPGAMVYGTIGPAAANFNSQFEPGTNAVSQNNTKIGWRFGGGIEVPAGHDVFLRLGYSYAAYGSYNVNYGSGIDSIAITESLLQAGALYRF